VISDLLPVKVSSDSPADVRLPVVPSTEVRGNLFFEGVSPNTDLGALRVNLVRSGQELSQVATATIEQDTRRFSIAGVGPGTYYPVVDLPPGLYVQNVIASKFEVDKPDDCDPKIPSPSYSFQDLHGHFDPLLPLRVLEVIPAAAQCLYIKVGAGYPLRGYVRDRAGQPANAAFVVAVPQSVWAIKDDRGATPPDRYLTGVTDDTGFFQLEGATPFVSETSKTDTEYRIYAFEDINPNVIYEPGFGGRFQNHSSFTQTEWQRESAVWVAKKIAILTQAKWNTCGGEDGPTVRTRCYFTLIPAEETVEVR